MTETNETRYNEQLRERVEKVQELLQGFEGLDGVMLVFITTRTDMPQSTLLGLSETYKGMMPRAHRSLLGALHNIYNSTLDMIEKAVEEEAAAKKEEGPELIVPSSVQKEKTEQSQERE